MNCKRFLITGCSGFVGRHFLNCLYEKKQQMDILGIDMKAPTFDLDRYADRLHFSFCEVNLLDRDRLYQVLAEFEPQYILHLASFSSVAYSWQHPEDSFVNNTNIFLNLTSVLKELQLPCRILSVGSSEEYGNVSDADLPLREDMYLKPVSPYAVARVSQEMLARVFVDNYGLDIILTRSFNHIGPWQDERFVVPSFIRRILNILDEASNSGSGVSDTDPVKGEIETGDVSIVRDFVDVRDVVEAYYLLLMRGTAGEIYNICSGHGLTLSDIVSQIGELCGVQVHTKVNPEFVRPNDNRVVIGSYDKIGTELGWKPVIPWEKTLSDMIDCMRDRMN